MSFQGLHAQSLPGFPSWVELVEEAVAQLCFQLAQFLLQYQVDWGNKSVSSCQSSALLV